MDREDNRITDILDNTDFIPYFECGLLTYYYNKNIIMSSKVKAFSTQYRNHTRLVVYIINLL
jgi:hypothetical protein